MDILNEIKHRPWSLPSKKWIMRQSWRNLLFIHWPVPLEDLRPYVPPNLPIETYRGNAWIGIVLFTVDGIFPRGLHSISVTSQFPEINVRTYVNYDGKPGVYFLSLDVNHWASLSIAKRWYRLPYYSADISLQRKGKSFEFNSKRNTPTNYPLSFKGTYTPLSDEFTPKPDTLDHWLTERYCLYSSDEQGRIYRGEIHHCPWALQDVRTHIYENQLFTPFQFDFSDVTPIFHFSEGLDAIIWNVEKV